jgi:pimeloyl-ACP methyl ester carboxylesterase
MGKLPNPVIVVPGITASYLTDLYPIPPETLWAVLTKEYERAALHPDDLKATLPTTARTYEAIEPAHVRSGQPYDVAYKELISELRYNLKAKEDEPVPVFAFGYDWRQPLEAVENELVDFIEEVRRRTALMRHYNKDGYGEDSKVNLVGHSMGGLVIADCLARSAGKLPVGKIVTLASPFQGSLEAVIKVTTGTANLGPDPPSSREREAARLTPGLFYLVPSFQEGLTITDSTLPKTLFDPNLWQPAIVDTISEYIRLHGVRAMNATDRRAMARDLFAAMLGAAQAHRKRVDTLDLKKAGLKPEDWLCVVGVNSTTRVRLRIDRQGQAAEFEFQSSDRDNQWSKSGATDAEKRVTGDGTVPFEGAIPKFLPYESLVCVRPEDFGYWEIQDKITLNLAGFHGIMPNMDMLHRLIVRFFKDAPDSHGNTWGFAPPGVSDDDWKPPLDLKKS